MESINWSPTQGGGGGVGEPMLENGDWRTQLQLDSRQRIVNKITDTLKRHLGQEELQELRKIAVRFEEKIYTAATSQSDYLRKISLKMLTMETKSQNTMANSLQSNSGSNGNNPQILVMDSSLPLEVEENLGDIEELGRDLTKVNLDQMIS